MKDFVNIVRSTDGGKSMMCDYFVKNFPDQILLAYNYAGKNMKEYLDNCSPEQLANYDFVKKIIVDFGDQTFPEKCVREKFNQKSILDAYRNSDKYKKQKFLLAILQGGDVKLYGGRSVYLTRDVRARWAVTQHRWNGVKAYSKTLRNEFKQVEPIKDSYPILVMKFEDLIQNQVYLFNKIREYMNLEEEMELIKPTIVYNEWLTKVDLYNIQAYVKNRENLKQEELDFISEFFKEYHETYGYPDHLTIDDIYPETLEQDIEDYMKGGQHVIPGQ